MFNVSQTTLDNEARAGVCEDAQPLNGMSGASYETCKLDLVRNNTHTDYWPAMAQAMCQNVRRGKANGKADSFYPIGVAPSVTNSTPMANPKCGYMHLLFNDNATKEWMFLDFNDGAMEPIGSGNNFYRPLYQTSWGF